MNKMNQRVWVIEDNPEKQVSTPKINESIISTFQQKSTKERNPSLAYSLSIIIWGCGQFYNRQWRLGIMFLLYMINFYLSMIIAINYWKPMKSFFESIGIDFSTMLLIFAFFYLLGLIVWQFNAWQAYLKSIKINPRSHKGIKIRFFPAFCSFLMPGWGQLLNGQTKKGAFFSVIRFNWFCHIIFIISLFF